MSPQPRALYLLNFISMWEYFSYYGMRVLLVLFMTQVLHLNDSGAFGLYALYTTLVELGGVAGGIIADRFLGLKRAIFLGGWTIACGHLCLAIPSSDATFFLGLGLIVVGTGLFRSNATILLGQFYEENDPRRDAGYTLYYTGINIGGFLATILCSIVGEVYGWHAAFSLAGFGMLLGNMALIFGRKLLRGKGEAVTSKRHNSFLEVIGLAIAAPAVAWAIYHNNMITPLIPIAAAAGIYYAWKQTKSCTLLEKVGLRRLALYVAFMIVFYGCEEQLGSSLVLFSERHVDRETAWGIIPAASLIMFNPLTILLTGPLLSKLMQKIPLQGMSKIGISFSLLGTAFMILYAGCLTASPQQSIPLALVIGSFVLIALGELFIGPTIYAYASEVAPRQFQGLVMGMVTMGFSLANLFSGMISQMMAVEEASGSLKVYSGGFGIIGLFSLLLGLVLMLVKVRKKVLLS